MNLLRNANIESLSQIEELVCTLLPAEARDKSLYAASGIGRHVRHILDHYRNLREGLDSGVIDYNSRERNSRIEESPAMALAVIADYRDWLLHTVFDETDPISIVSEVSTLQSTSVTIPSNVARELHYIAYHSIHHVAYCALLANRQGRQVNPAIGVAPGTATYQRSLQA